MVGRTKSLPVWVFVEGGGLSRDEQTAIRHGFAKFFDKLLVGRSKPKVIPCGGRDRAFRDWQNALRSHPDTLSLLLVDSEGPVSDEHSLWDHVPNWPKPSGAQEGRLFFMVQAMEAWFLADKQALARFYGKDFLPSGLPDRPDIEFIPKSDLESALRRASKSTTKGAYIKSHGFELIGQMDPTKIRSVAPHAERFFDTLESLCSSR